MLLAIDVGNTHTVYGLWDGAKWVATWRRGTNAGDTEDEIAAWLKSLFDLSGLPFAVDGAICGSVVPTINYALTRLCTRFLNVPLMCLHHGDEVGLSVEYDPPHAVGADRIANAIGALARFEPPIVVVDFGTATTFDVVDRRGVYVGGAIMPGVDISTRALVQGTAKLPQVEFVPPSAAIGKNTVSSLQSGIVIGYAGSVDALTRRIVTELGGKAKVIATGGLGKLFIGVCETIESHEARLTLEGLVIAHERLSQLRVS